MNLLPQESYIVPPQPALPAVNPQTLPQPIIFHDGRLVPKPTPLRSLLLLLYLPFAIPLSLLRLSAGALLPLPLSLPVLRLLGLIITIPSPPPPPSSPGSLFVLSHRTLLDPILLSVALRRPVPALTYSLSRLSELLSPIKTVRLTRRRDTDANTIRALLSVGDLAICPEGTTCREPFLLRFSALFAELTDEIVPVAMRVGVSVFYGTTARGWKGLDSVYFLMNPRPVYEVWFLGKLGREETCGGGGRSGCEVADFVQGKIAGRLGYRCTSLTRKDKYEALAGNDGVVVEKKKKKGSLRVVFYLCSFWEKVSRRVKVSRLRDCE